MKKYTSLVVTISIFGILLISGCNTEEKTETVTPSEPCTGLICESDDPSSISDATGKPVIYLYPSEPTSVQVALDYKGTLTTTYPQITDGQWTVLAEPDGTLTMNDRQFGYLFWEGLSPLTQTFDFSEGFSVARADYISFLEEKLTLLGLNEMEQDDFITYWLPRMNASKWSTVRFLTDEYENMASLEITPQPNHIIRVFMLVQGSDHFINLSEQTLAVYSEGRDGFSAVEWGGTLVH